MREGEFQSPERGWAGFANSQVAASTAYMGFNPLSGVGRVSPAIERLRSHGIRRFNPLSGVGRVSPPSVRTVYLRGVRMSNATISREGGASRVIRCHTLDESIHDCAELEPRRLFLRFSKRCGPPRAQQKRLAWVIRRAPCIGRRRADEEAHLSDGDAVRGTRGGRPGDARGRPRQSMTSNASCPRTRPGPTP